MPNKKVPDIIEVMAMKEAAKKANKNGDLFMQELQQDHNTQEGKFLGEQKTYGESPIKHMTENAKCLSNKPPRKMKPRWDFNTSQLQHDQQNIHDSIAEVEEAYPVSEEGYALASDEDAPCCDLSLDPPVSTPPAGVTFTISPGSTPNPSDYGYQSGSIGGYPKKTIKERPVMGDTMIAQPAMPEDIDIFKSHAVIEKVNEKLHVTAIAIDKKKPDNNTIESIKSHGDSLGGYAYDTGTDSYLVNCCSNISLGTIPLVLRLTVPGHNGKILMPLPEALIHKYMSPQQRRLMRLFVEANQGCEIQFIQCLARA